MLISLTFSLHLVPTQLSRCVHYNPLDTSYSSIIQLRDLPIIAAFPSLRLGIPEWLLVLDRYGYGCRCDVDWRCFCC